MGWPKGKPRKGHINKDGTPHAKHGTKVGVGVVVSRLPVGVDPFKEVPRKRPVPASVSEVREETEEKVDEVWGMKGVDPVTEPCVNCLYAYASGGWCPECGYSRAIVREPYDTNRGRKLG